MSSPARKPIWGCGKTAQIFTLYKIDIEGKALPLTCGYEHGFDHLACGSSVICADWLPYPEGLADVTYGILLCSNCADRLNFLQDTTTTKRDSPPPV